MISRSFFRKIEKGPAGNLKFLKSENLKITAFWSTHVPWHFHNGFKKSCTYSCLLSNVMFDRSYSILLLKSMIAFVIDNTHALIGFLKRHCKPFPFFHTQRRENFWLLQKKRLENPRFPKAVRLHIDIRKLVQIHWMQFRNLHTRTSCHSLVIHIDSPAVDFSDFTWEKAHAEYSVMIGIPQIT